MGGTVVTGLPQEFQAAKGVISQAIPAGHPEFEDQAKDFTGRIWNDVKSAYLIYHQSIWESTLFYVNQSWLERDDSKKLWKPVTPEDDFTPQPRLNRFSPSVDAMASNFQVPEVEATASKPDDEVSTAVADIATKVAQHFLKVNGFRSEYATSDDDPGGTASQLFVLAGCVFSQVWVESKVMGQVPLQQQVDGAGLSCPACDTYTAVPAEGLDPAAAVCPQCQGPMDAAPTKISQPVLGPDGQPVMAPIEQATVRGKIDSPLCAFPRPGSKSMNSSPYFLYAQRETLDEIWRRWQFEAEADAIWPDGYNSTYENALNYYYLGTSGTAQQAKDSCMVLQMFVEPGKMRQWPDGLYAVVINGKCAVAKPWSEFFADQPFTKGGYLPIHQLFFPRTPAFDLVEVQKERNQYDSLISLHAKTSAVDPVVVDENTVVSEITGRADKIIYWKAIGPNSKEPHRLEHGSLDEGVYAMRENLNQEFQNISMAVNSFRGQKEPGVTAGVAIEALRSQAEQMFSKPSVSWATFWKETARKGTKLIQRHYSVQQLKEIIGPQKDVEIQQFKRADLDTMVEFVATQHGLPRTRDEKRQEMMMLFDKGALDVNDPKVKQKIFELFGDTGLMSSFNLDATRARMENAAMKAGTPMTVMPEIEDLAVHRDIHLDAAKSLEFNTWPPMAQQLLYTHIMETNAAIQQKQMQAVLMGAPPPAAPPKPGAPKPGAGKAAA